MTSMTKKLTTSNDKKSLNIRFISLVGFVFQLLIHEAICGKCGVVDVVVPRILFGTRSQRGEWPFVVALFQVQKFEFFCGGSLISSKHVLTAAHCIQGKYSQHKLSPDEVVVRIGGYDLSTIADNRSVVERNISEIHVHHEWDVYSDNYDADLAILVLNETVAFTNFIRPVCIPTGDVITVGARGSIVGWGLTENHTSSHLQYPRHAYTNALSDSYCYTSDHIVAVFSSLRTFCGGGDGSPNIGDSGGGFFVLSGSVWVQHGIISALRVNATGIVDGNSFAIYTSVKPFKSWIENTVSKSGVELNNEVDHKINLNCLYEDDRYYNYTCIIHSSNVDREHLEIASFIGTHLPGKTCLDVRRIIFKNGTLFYIPDAIGNIFKNVKDFQISYAGFKLSRRSNFKNFDNLITLNFFDNDIEILDENTFLDLPNLEVFVLRRNKIKVLHERTFESNLKLREVRLDYNQIEFLHKDVFENNASLEKVGFTGNSLKIIETDFSAIKKICYVDLLGNNCIDSYYDSVFINLTDFQDLIWSDCSADP